MAVPIHGPELGTVLDVLAVALVDAALSACLVPDEERSCPSEATDKEDP